MGRGGQHQSRLDTVTVFGDSSYMHTFDAAAQTTHHDLLLKEGEGSWVGRD